MDYYSYENIKINLGFIQSIHSLDFIKKVNEHGYLTIKAIVKEEHKDTYINNIGEIELKLIDDTVLFKGMVLNIDFSMEGDFWYVILKCVTCTFMLDIKKERTSFQNKNLTYKQVIDNVLEKYSNATCISTVSKDKTIENFTMQYDETDWEFLKRMASRLNKCLFADNEMSRPAFYFGNPVGKSIGELKKFNFSVSKNMEYFLNASKGQYSELTELDVTEFSIETKKNYEVGDNVLFQEVKLYIKEKRFIFTKGSLKFRLKLQYQIELF